MFPMYRLDKSERGAFWFKGEPILSFCTKEAAWKVAKSIGLPKRTITKIGNRFFEGYGLYDPEQAAFVGKCPLLLAMELTPYGYTRPDWSKSRVR